MLTSWDFMAVLKKRPEVANLNVTALKAGYYFGETAELFPVRYQVAPAPQPAGKYRRISGNEATVIGFVALTTSTPFPFVIPNRVRKTSSRE